MALTAVRQTRIDAILQHIALERKWDGRGVFRWVMQQFNLSQRQAEADVRYSLNLLHVEANIDPQELFNACVISLRNDIFSIGIAAKDRHKAHHELAMMMGWHTKRLVIEGSEEAKKKFIDYQAKLLENPDIRAKLIEINKLSDASDPSPDPEEAKPELIGPDDAYFASEDRNTQVADVLLAPPPGTEGTGPPI
jgi:hypothetical protein